MRYLLLVLLLPYIISCSTTAIQSDDGRMLSIKGNGSAKFENGSEISRDGLFPKLPAVKINN